MELCMFGITRKNRKRNKWIRQKTGITNVFHSIKSIKDTKPEEQTMVCLPQQRYGTIEIEKDQKDAMTRDGSFT